MLMFAFLVMVNTLVECRSFLNLVLAHWCFKPRCHLSSPIRR